LWHWRDDYGTEAEWAIHLGSDIVGNDLWQIIAA
jgi:hypothetical protein